MIDHGRFATPSTTRSRILGEVVAAEGVFSNWETRLVSGPVKLVFFREVKDGTSIPYFGA
jgi:hypothetical protein